MKLPKLPPPSIICFHPALNKHTWKKINSLKFLFYEKISLKQKDLVILGFNNVVRLLIYRWQFDPYISKFSNCYQISYMAWIWILCLLIFLLRSGTHYQELMKSMIPYIVSSMHALLTSCIGAPNYYQVTFC
jgi:hypothetical protein